MKFPAITLPRNSRWMIPSCCGLLSLVVVPALACNIPVFRYALERWRSDPIEVTVFHEGALSSSAQQQIHQLRAAGPEQGGEANIRIHTRRIDDETPHSEWQDLVKKLSLKQPSLPFVVASGKHVQGEFIAWYGSLDRASQELVDSPARRKIAQRLLAGDAIVWLIVRSDESAKSLQLHNRLEKQLKQLERSVELPEGIGLPGSELFAQIPLLMQFSIVEVDRSDDRESFLLGLAEGFQPEAFQRGEALIIPVFGRGRALEVIPESRLSENLTHDLTQFLCAACSCQVKEQNPGFDLLVCENWDRELFGEDGEKPPASAEGLGQRKQPVLLEIPKGRPKN